MELIIIASKIQGYYKTVDSIQKALNVERSTTLKILSQLRKAGYVKTHGGGKQMRLYDISPTPHIEIGYPGLYEIINKHSPIKLAVQYEHRVSKPLTIEETIIRAAIDKSIRVYVASLALFRYVTDWKLLGKLAVEAGIGRHIGAMYDLSKKAMRVRRMDQRTEKKLLNSKVKSKFLLENFKSKNLQEIEKRWRVFIPINRADMEIYKEWQST